MEVGKRLLNWIGYFISII